MRVSREKLDISIRTLVLFSVLFIGIFYVDIQLSFRGIHLWLIEILTLGTAAYLLIWYKRSSVKERKTSVIPVSTAIGILFAVYCSLLLLLFTPHVAWITGIALRKQEAYEKEKNSYIPFVTTLMDKAEKTNVRRDIDQQYDEFLSYRLRSDGYEYKGRRPVYFIRLRGDTIEKLFQSGTVKYEPVNTAGERKVVEMLQGKRYPHAFPQYTCCGGDDIWPEMPILRMFLPERRYLKDFPSELETIILIKDSDGFIRGAMVDLHGD